MKAKLLILFVFGLFLSVQHTYGDNIPLKGGWDNDILRSIVPLAPVLSIDDNILSVQFMDALDDLTVRVTNDSGIVIYEQVISGEMNEILDITLEGLTEGAYRVTLIHSFGRLQGDFEVL